MITFLIPVVVVATSLWVYWDATSNNIGKTEDGKGFFNMSAGAWAIAMLLLWIVAFPAYLVKRGDLIEIAKVHPAKANGRNGKIAALAIAGVGFLVVSVGVPGPGLPICGSDETTALVGQVVSDMPVVKLTGAQFVSLKNISELGYNSGTQIRSCSGTLITTLGEDSLQYSVQWLDKAKGIYSVNAQIIGY